MSFCSSKIRRVAISALPVLGVSVSEMITLFDSIGAELGRAGNKINQLARHANVLEKQHKLDATIVSFFQCATIGINSDTRRFGESTSPID